MPTFLISNDDGYRAPGIRALARFAGELGEVYTVAPDREQSASSHALTLHRPLRIENEGQHVWAVDGTPTDAVHIALRGQLLPQPPDLVLSGINHGANLGDEVTYSGTVAAAMEACLLGVPSIAFSCTSRDPEHDELDQLKSYVLELVAGVLEHGLPKGTFLNVNFPDPRRGPVRGLVATRQGRRVYGAEVVEKTDPRRRKYYWIAGEVVETDVEPGTDVAAIEAGYAAVTPVHMDLTDYRQLEALRAWPLLHDELPVDRT